MIKTLEDKIHNLLKETIMINCSLVAWYIPYSTMVFYNLSHSSKILTFILVQI